jgi:hypothetical protein
VTAATPLSNGASKAAERLERIEPHPKLESKSTHYNSAVTSMERLSTGNPLHQVMLVEKGGWAASERKQVPIWDISTGVSERALSEITPKTVFMNGVIEDNKQHLIMIYWVVYVMRILQLQCIIVVVVVVVVVVVIIIIIVNVRYRYRNYCCCCCCRRRLLVFFIALTWGKVSWKR